MVAVRAVAAEAGRPARSGENEAGSISSATGSGIVRGNRPTRRSVRDVSRAPVFCPMKRLASLKTPGRCVADCWLFAHRTMRNANAPGSSSRPGKMGLRAALSCSQLKLLAVDGDGAAMDPRKLPKLQGSLQKRHQHSCLADWGTRYLRVDDRRGVIYYFRSRGASLWDEPAGLFLLRSLESVSALAIPQLPHAFELRFRTQGEGGGGSPSRLLKRSKRDDGPGDEGNPPREPRSSLLLRASSEHELQKWVVGLQTRMAIQAAADAPVPPPAMGPPDPDSAAAAILNATHAASVIAERVASDTSAAEICAAMGVVGAGSRHASLGAAPRKGCAPSPRPTPSPCGRPLCF